VAPLWPSRHQLLLLLLLLLLLVVVVVVVVLLVGPRLHLLLPQPAARLLL
jgi:hypothetical protein